MPLKPSPKNVGVVDDIMKRTGLTESQVDDLLKNTGLSPDELSELLKTKDLDDKLESNYQKYVVRNI